MAREAEASVAEEPEAHRVAEEPETHRVARRRRDECRAQDCDVELGPDELHRCLRLACTSTETLKSAARVCTSWRAAAYELRRDLVWQLEHLACRSGVPEPLLLPHTRDQLR